MHKHLIIHIDDDLDDLELIAQELKRYQHVEVLQFTDAEKGLQTIYQLVEDKNPPCLILLDINIPGLNGKDALVRLRSHPLLKHIPVTMFTTSTASMDVKFAEKHNAYFVTKPVNIDLLRTKVDAFILTCDSHKLSGQ